VVRRRVWLTLRCHELKVIAPVTWSRCTCVHLYVECRLKYITRIQRHILYVPSVDAIAIWTTQSKYSTRHRSRLLAKYIAINWLNQEMSLISPPFTSPTRVSACLTAHSLACTCMVGYPRTWSRAAPMSDALAACHRANVTHVQHHVAKQTDRRQNNRNMSDSG
jgi:hypothetical protein